MSNDKTYNVVWSSLASVDLMQIVKFIAYEDATTAAKVSSEIIKSVDSLWKFPNRGRNIVELEQFGSTAYKELIFKSWRIIYKITAGSVNILAIIDSRRNIEDLIMARIIYSNN